MDDNQAAVDDGRTFNGPFHLKAPQFGSEDIKQLQTSITTQSGRKASEFQLKYFLPNCCIEEKGNAIGNGCRRQTRARFGKGRNSIHIELKGERKVTHIVIVGSKPCIDPNPRVGVAGQSIWLIHWIPAWLTSYELYCRMKCTDP